MKSLVTHTKNPGARHCVILVHGFTGGGKTFQDAKGKYLFEHLDKQISEQCDFLSFIYHTWLFDFKVTRGILKLLPFIRRYIPTESNRDIEEYSALLKTHFLLQSANYDTVSFICHSMGGVLVKHLILAELHDGRPFTGFYITLATPHRGVEEAKTLAILSNRQIDKLRPFSKGIYQISSEWSKVAPGVKARYYRAIDDDVVDSFSSCPEGEESRVVDVDGSHSSICKPATDDCALIRHLNATIAEFISSPARTAGERYTESLEDRVLFLGYRADREPYYLTRNVDTAISNGIRNSNLWISGPSGCGKTVAVQHGLLGANTPFVFVDLSPCNPASTIEQLYESIYAQVLLAAKANGFVDSSSSVNSTDSFVTRTSLLLSQLKCGGLLHVAIDEIPLSSASSFEAFVNTTIGLITYHANRQSKTSCRFVISTHYSPLGQMNPNSEDKFPAYFTHRALTYWDSSDMLGLLDLILDSLHINILENERQKVVEAALGSPRKLKNVLKNYMMFSRAGGTSIARSITETAREDE